MAAVALKSAAGAEVGSVELSDAVFGIVPNPSVLHQTVVAQLAARRAGTQSAKTRSEVSGGGKKPFKQKGTGSARQGSTRSPSWSGGGVAHAPKPRKYTQKVNKKVVRLALRSALSDRFATGNVLVVNEWAFEAPSTKGAQAALTALGVDGKVLVVLGHGDDIAWKSFRNLTNVQSIDAAELNAYDVLCNKWILFTERTLPSGDHQPALGAESETPVAIASASSEVSA
jgi:large subunit ribosomal protein L4